MGQYLGERKIGTCESMYYMRLKEAQKLAEQGAKDNDGILFSDYLKDDVTRFRFPFPTEDTPDGIGDIRAMQEAWNKGFDIPAGCIEVNHQTITTHNAHTEGGYGLNIFLPCPYSKAFRDLGLKMSMGGAGEQFLTVRYQAIRDGKEKTIFACARCGQEQRFDDEDVENIKARAIEYFSVYDTRGKGDSYRGNQGLYDYATEIINRIK